MAVVILIFHTLFFNDLVRLESALIVVLLILLIGFFSGVLSYEPETESKSHTIDCG